MLTGTSVPTEDRIEQGGLRHDFFRRGTVSSIIIVHIDVIANFHSY